MALLLKLCQLSLAFLVSACGGSASRQVFSFGGSETGRVSSGFCASAGVGISPISLANALERSEIRSEDCSFGGSVAIDGGELACGGAGVVAGCLGRGGVVIVADSVAV